MFVKCSFKQALNSVIIINKHELRQIVIPVLHEETEPHSSKVTFSEQDYRLKQYDHRASFSLNHFHELY